MKTVINFVKKEIILIAAWILAIISMFFVAPSAKYISYIDFRSLGILWALMVIMAGLKENGFFDKVGQVLLSRTKKIYQLALVLVFLCFFFSMFITNDVALITFVPFAIYILKECNREYLMIPVVVLQTLAANLGSMLTPIGNPQNLYLYGISGMSLAEFVKTLLPYTILTLVMLVVSVLLLKGKNQAVVSSGSAQPSAHTLNHENKSIFTNPKTKTIIYGVLFILALLVVAKIIPYYILVGVVLVVVLMIQRKILIKVDYALLFTFIGFFIFTGNMGQLPVIAEKIASLISGHEVVGGVIVSQVISNVPAALLLSGFTTNYSSLLIGVNLGGLGTLIASMASLISFKAFSAAYPTKKGRFFLYFTLMNVIYLAALLGLYFIIR